MKTLCFCLAVLLISGCREEKDKSQQNARHEFPGLTESPLPPPPMDSGVAASGSAVYNSHKAVRHRSAMVRESASPTSSTGNVPATAFTQHSREPEPPSTVIMGDSSFDREMEKMDQVKRMREYAAHADPDDPFALTEEEIEVFSKLDNPIIN